MIRIGIVGASGYTAGELLKILQRHPHVEVVRATSRQNCGNSVASSHAHLAKYSDLTFSTFEIQDFLDADVKCAFTCLPHAASAKAVMQLLDHGIKVIDFSADYRLNDVATFEQWYQVTHPDPDRVGTVPYGLPELFRDEIKAANLVANPGCFPTTAILPLAPLVKNELVMANPIIVDSKSGISGAGRNPKSHLHFPEANESVSAYSIGTHRHGPEIEQILTRSTKSNPQVVFTPHLIPMDRGILSTIYLRPTSGQGINETKLCLEQMYRDEPFVRLRATPPRTKDVINSNFGDIHVAANGDHLILICAIDNLVKGASGAAVQNFNLLFEFPETTGLI